MEKYYQVIVNELDEDGNRIKEAHRTTICQKVILLTDSESCILSASIIDMVGIFASADTEITTAAAAGTMLHGEVERRLKKKDDLEELLNRLKKEGF